MQYSEIHFDVTGPMSPTCVTSDAYLCCRDVLHCRLLLQVPDDHQASSIADDHLTRVEGVLLEGLHMLQVPAADVVMWYAAMMTENE